MKPTEVEPKTVCLRVILHKGKENRGQGKQNEDTNEDNDRDGNGKYDSKHDSKRRQQGTKTIAR